MNTHYSHTNKLTQEIRLAVLYKYILIGIFTVSILLSGDRFIFPFSRLMPMVYIALVINTVILFLTFLSRILKPLYLSTFYVDLIFIPIVFLYTGGFISPFIVQYVIAVMIYNLIYKHSRSIGWHTFIFLIISYIVVSLGQKYGYIHCYVPYCCELMRNDRFFFMIFIYNITLITFAHIMVLYYQKNVHDRLKSMLFTQEKIMKGFIGTEEKFFSTLVEQLAGALKVKVAACGLLGGNTDTISNIAVWSAAGPAPLSSFSLSQQPFVNHYSYQVNSAKAGSTLITSSFHELDYAVNRWCCGVRDGTLLSHLLLDSDAKTIGILYALNDGPLQDIDIAQSLIKIFASRASSEMERRKVELESRAIQEKLNQSQKMEALGQLAGGVAHDFNNILCSIMGYAQILQKKLGKESSPHGKYTLKIVDLTKKAASLTGQLLAFARKGKFRVVPVDIHNSIRDTIGMLDTIFDQKIKFHSNMAAQESTIMGDPSLLENMLINLSLNARDAMPEGGTISFDTSLLPVDEPMLQKKSVVHRCAPGEYLILKIRDTGSGIPPEILPHIFEPFFTTKAMGKGTGLGLAAVYGCIENHRGWIEVESQPGVGTEFSLYLPLEKSIKAATYRFKGDGMSTIKANISLLFVDDDIEILTTYSEALALYGYTIQTFSSGRQALDYYRQAHDRVDVVILDLKMPETSGKQVFEEMIKINPSLRCIVTTGFIQDSEAQSILSKGATVDLVGKPFQIENLIESLEKLYSLPALRADKNT